MGRATLLLGLVLLLFDGCASGPLAEQAPEATEAKTASRFGLDATPADTPPAVETAALPPKAPKATPQPSGDELGGDGPEEDDFGDEDGGDTAAGPYTERAGADENPDEPAPTTWVFLAPLEAQPVARAKRPKLPIRSRLAVVLIRGGELSYAAKPVLDLGNLLSRENELGGVFALGDESLAAEVEVDGVLTLETFAAAAKREGRELVLVDITPGPIGASREGYLLHAASGALLAYYEVRKDAPSGASASSGAPDLVARIGAAYGRLQEKAK